MSSLNEIARERTDLTDGDVEWLHRLLADWQLLADLSFADLVLWLPLRDGGGFVATAQMRPTTGPTVYHDDVVGAEVPTGRRPQLDAAYRDVRICRETDPDWPDDIPVREETIPVVREGRVVGVVSRHTNLAAARTPSRLELTYLRTADDLAVMLSQGRFPGSDADEQTEFSPRVGDGFIRLDEAGVVVYASPNALSAYRRLGLSADLSGLPLGETTAALALPTQPVDEALATVVSGWAPRQAEVEAAGASLRLRVIPLTPEGVRTAALVLCRDVTEVRRRERELVGKDATIREIHHRVKNNLQTVAALLRLQARRLGEGGDGAAREALEEAERRVGSIAMVHETLSRTLEGSVAFDEIADRVCSSVGETTATGRPVRVQREGSFGQLPPEVATPLALVLVELVQNAVEHAFPDGSGSVVVRAARAEEEVRLEVADDGVGLPAGFDVERSPGLGLQIVRTLVEGELGGVLTVLNVRAGGPGYAVAVRVPVVPAGT